MAPGRPAVPARRSRPAARTRPRALRELLCSKQPHLPRCHLEPTTRESIMLARSRAGRLLASPDLREPALIAFAVDGRSQLPKIRNDDFGECLETGAGKSVAVS